VLGVLLDAKIAIQLSPKIVKVALWDIITMLIQIQFALIVIMTLLLLSAKYVPLWLIAKNVQLGII
jgi:hypothetical protein